MPIGSLSRGYRQDANFAKLGYYPTDDETLRRLAQWVIPEDATQTTIALDPCCGEGAAMQTLAKHWQGKHAAMENYGIEYDAERFKAATHRLDCVLHADAINDCWLSKSWAGFMLFNPPYGDVRGEYREGSKTAKRLEAEFWAHHAARVQRGGIMAALLPQSAFTKAPGLVKAMSHYFAGERVGVYQAAVDTYRQILVIGYRRRDRSAPQNKALLTRLTQIGIGVEIPEPLPAATSDPFRCPAGLRPDSFEAQSITRESVEMALTQESGDTLQAVEAELSAQHAVRTHPPSVVPLRQGHIPILLAAGGLDGIVEDDTGRYLVKGSVRREAVTRIDRDNDGETEREKTSVTYRWLTRIMAWDLTPGQDFRLLTIE